MVPGRSAQLRCYRRIQTAASMWDGKEEFNRETGCPFAEDSDGNFYAFLVENGVCSKDVVAEQGAGGDLSYTDYEDFFEFVAEVGFGVDIVRSPFTVRGSRFLVRGRATGRWIWCAREVFAGFCCAARLG